MPFAVQQTHPARLECPLRSCKPIPARAECPLRSCKPIPARAECPLRPKSATKCPQTPPFGQNNPESAPIPVLRETTNRQKSWKPKAIMAGGLARAESHAGPTKNRPRSRQRWETLTARRFPVLSCPTPANLGMQNPDLPVGKPIQLGKIKC